MKCLVLVVEGERGIHLGEIKNFMSKLYVGGAGDLLGQLLRGGHLSINDVCHFLNL